MVQSDSHAAVAHRAAGGGQPIRTGRTRATRSGLRTGPPGRIVRRGSGSSTDMSSGDIRC